MYMLDTCVFSEFSRKQPHESVLVWANTIKESDQYLSCLVLGELLHGVLRLPDGLKKKELQHWVESLSITHHRRIISVDSNVGREWAVLVSRLEAQGVKPPVMDSLIAASALAHGLTLVTRNVADFQSMGVRLLNPWA
jgi:toxin FitB